MFSEWVRRQAGQGSAGQDISRRLDAQGQQRGGEVSALCHRGKHCCSCTQRPALGYFLSVLACVICAYMKTSFSFSLQANADCSESA